MKNLVIFFMIVFSLILTAQDYEPAQFKVRYKENDTLLDITTMPEFQTKEKFIGGLHWGSSRLYVKNNKFTNVHCFSSLFNDILPSEGLPDSCNLTINVYGVADFWDNRSNLNYPSNQWHPDDQLWGRYNYAPAAIGIQYEPTLLIDPTFTFKDNDTTRSIFGFEYIDGTIPAIGNSNYDRLTLSTSGTLPRKVLSHKWMSDALANKGSEGSLTKSNGADTLIKVYKDFLFRNNINDIMTHNETNGDKIYLSVNLRALNNNGSSHDKILGLRLKYITLPYKNSSQVFVRDSGYIKFDSIPKYSSSSDTFQLKYNRGTARKLTPTSFPFPDTFFVKQGMLKDATSSRPDITLSAHFELNPNALTVNPFLKNKAGQSNASQLIDSLQVEVIYMGVAPVAIDWIRLETKHAQYVHRGYYDSCITTKFQHTLDTLTSARFTKKGIKFTGLYTRDEPPFSVYSQIHYFTKLLGNIATFEGDVNYWKQQKHYFNKVNSWSIQNHCQYWQAYPFVNKRGDIYGLTDKYNFGLGQGLAWSSYNPLNTTDTNNRSIFKSISNSDYETFISDSVNSDWTVFYKKDYKKYIDTVKAWNLSENQSFQSVFQKRTHDIYANSNNNSYLYDGTKWWSQTNLDIIFLIQLPDSSKPKRPMRDFDNKNVLDEYGNPIMIYPPVVATSRGLGRHVTGDEMSMFNYQSLLFGAKGLIYDGEASSKFYDAEPGSLRMSHGWQYDNDSARSWLNSLSSEEYSYSDSTGSDFLSLDTAKEWTRLNHYINFDKFQESTKTSKYRLYLGRKSMRTTVYKIHRWVRQNEDLFLRLKFQSWIGKGFKYDVLNAPYARSASSIIDTANIRTRKLFYIADTNISNYVQHAYKDNPKENYENHDSSFYDVTVLLDTNKTIDSVFYIGVVNRRTDPLVLNTQNDGVNYFQNFYFASTAEYDEGVKTGKNVYHFNNETTTIVEFKDTTYWRDMWWKRFGAREITIPFNFRPYAPGGAPVLDSNKYCLLRVREVYDNSASASNIRNWTNTKLIDTIIGQDSRLAMNFIPGEGKLLKVEVIYPPDGINGNLSKSNQHKLVCLPMINNYGQEIDSVIYFATYHRKEVDTTKVFLRASYPIKKDVSGVLENIRWQNEIQVSKDIQYYLNGQNIPMLNPLTCQYPSIVAQKDSLNGNSGYLISMVYACDRKVVTNLSFDQFIAYTLFRFNSSTQLISTIGNIARYNVCGESKEYGHPVINASKNNNFVAFSDSLGGIIYSAFAKNQYNYLSLDSVNCQPNYFMFQNPSFNAYSNLVNGDTTASLVWTGRTKIGALLGDSYPFYTRLKLTSIGAVVNFIPNINTASGNNFIDWGYEISGDSSYIKFIWGGRAARYPIVYKVVRPTTGNGDGQGNEYLSWQRSYENDTVNFLFNLKLGFVPSQNLFGVNNHFTLVVRDVNDYGFTHPNIAQKNGRTGYDPTPSSEAVLNFTYNQNIWQKPLTNSVFMTHLYQSVSESTLTNQFEKLARGDFSHLSMSPKENDSVNMWKNRRIYNDSTQSTIYTSAKMFYKAAIGGGSQYAEGYVGYECDTANYYIQFPKLNGNDLNLFLPYKNSFDSTLGIILVQNNLDTIKSEWFTIGTSEYLQLKSFGTQNANCMLFIQRQDSNAIYPITYTMSNSEWLTTKLNITLTNGGGHNYRLVFKRIVDSTYHYMERVVFGELDIASNLNLKSSSNVENQVINMMTGTKAESIYNIIAMPNPAENDVKLMFTVPNTFDSKSELNNVNFEIINQVGKVVMSKSTNSNQIEQINLKDYNQGVYFVRATFVNNITKAIEETKLIPLYIVR